MFNFLSIIATCCKMEFKKMAPVWHQFWRKKSIETVAPRARHGTKVETGCNFLNADPVNRGTIRKRNFA